MKFEAESREFAKFLRSLENFIQTVLSEQFLVTECFFNNYNSNWKKLLVFRNLQEKLENDTFLSCFVYCLIIQNMGKNWSNS